MFAAMSGLLLGPTIGLSVILLILLVVQAFGAAAVGYFSNLPLTYVGGLLIGIAAALSTKYINDITWLGGLPIEHPVHRAVRRAAGDAPAAARPAPYRRHLHRRTLPTPHRPRVSIGGAVVLVGVLVFIPDLVGVKLAAWTIAVASS